MDVVPGSVELYVLTLIVSSIQIGVFRTSVAPRAAFIPFAFFLAVTLFFAIGQLLSERKFRQFLVQMAFIALPATLMVLWILHR